MTNRETWPHLVKAYKNLVSPAFNQHVYTSEDEFRALRWVMERDINLKGFRLELKGRWYTVTESGHVLAALINKHSLCYALEIAKYYATRGKLTNLDASFGRHTVLTYASHEGHLNIVEALLVAGANKNGTGSYCDTPLICAARSGRVDCLKFLLSAGVDKEKGSNYGNTALNLASFYCHVECVKILLAAKADVNKPTKGGSTPLMRASINNSVEIVKLLLAAGAKKDKITINGKTALTLATQKGHHEIV
jgi:ankyrin repeat protein